MKVYLQLGFTLCPPWQALSPSVHMTLNCRHVSFSHPFWRCHMLGIANVSVNTVHAPLASVGCWHVRGTAPVTVMFKRPCCRSCKDLKKICISCWWSEGYKANARSSFLLLSMFFLVWHLVSTIVRQSLPSLPWFFLHRNCFFFSMWLVATD